jgi:hypothetical protein
MITIENLNLRRFIALYWAMMWRGTIGNIIGFTIGIGVGYIGTKLNVSVYIIHSIGFMIGIVLSILIMKWFLMKTEYNSFSYEIVVNYVPIHWFTIVIKIWWALVWRALVCACIGVAIGMLLDWQLKGFIPIQILFANGLILGLIFNMLSFYWFLNKQFYKGFHLSIFGKQPNYRDEFQDEF